jgi:cobyrinic acid a,c-diamide synthase
MDGELYYGTHFITPLTVYDARIRGDGLSTFQMDVTLTGSILNTIEPENKNQYILQGELVATNRILGMIPVTVTKSLSDYKPGQT